MKRFSNWRSKLHECIEERRRLPMAYGTNDCALFVADCVLAMTGEDLAVDYRGKYDSAASAITFLYDLGYDDLVSLVGDKLPEISPVQARVGDIAAFDAGLTGWALGIVNGETVTVMTEKGLGVVYRDLVVRAFKCG